MNADLFSEALGGLLLAIATFAIAYITKKARELANEHIDEKKREYLYPILEIAIGYARKVLPDTPPNSKLVDVAARYVREAAPDALKTLGANESVLRDMLIARL